MRHYSGGRFCGSPAPSAAPDSESAARSSPLAIPPPAPFIWLWEPQHSPAEPLPICSAMTSALRYGIASPSITPPLINGESRPQGIVRWQCCLFLEQVARILCASSFRMTSGTSCVRIWDSTPPRCFSVSSFACCPLCCPLLPDLRNVVRSYPGLPNGRESSSPPDSALIASVKTGRSETGKMVLMGLHAQEHSFPERMLYQLSMASVNPIPGARPGLGAGMRVFGANCSPNRPPSVAILACCECRSDQARRR